MASKPRQSVAGSRGESGRVKEKESPPVPDSTTEPPPIPAQRFQEGDEVFYQTDSRQQMLGTVAEVIGQTCLVQFGDGTEQLAQFKRLKKLFEDEEEVVQPKRKKSESTPPVQPQPRPQQTCTSCGVSRRITATKAKLYDNDLKQFKCRRCLKNSQTPKNPHMEIMGPITSSLKGKLPPDVSIIPTGAPVSAFSLPSTSSYNSLPKPKSASHNSPVSISKHIQFSVISGKKNFCFSCEQLVQAFDSVGCNFCDRPCHLSCLHLSPTPLNGDTFWHLVCSTCGNQNSNEKVEKKFGVRRNLANWGDLAYLLISCLSVASSHRMFDFEKEMLPFLEEHWDSLHIPRQFKSHPSEARNRFILNALQNSPQRFQNGKEFRLKLTLWGIRSNDYGIKERISSIATQMGLKQTVKSVKKAVKTVGVGNNYSQAPQPSPDLLRFIASTKPMSQIPSPIPNVSEYESDTTTRTDESLTDREWPKEESINHAFPPPGENLTASGSGSSTSSSSTSSEMHHGKAKAFSRNSRRDDTTGDNKNRTESKEIEDQQGSNAPKGVKYIKRKHSEGSSTAINKASFGSPSQSSQKKRRKTPYINFRKLSIPSSAGDSERVVNGRSSTIVRSDESAPTKSTKSPSKIFIESPPVSDDEDEGKDDEIPHVSLKLHNQTSKLTSPPRALKSASSVPLSPHQLKTEIEKNKRGPKKGGVVKPSEKPENKTVEGIENVSRPKRGRPSGKVGTTTKRIEPAGNGRTLRRPNPKDSKIQVSRRVGTFSSISERRPVPPEIEDSSAFNFVNEFLFDAAVYSGYRIHCLPRSPGTEVERRNETLKVFSHLRIEKDAEMATSLLSRSEAETRSQTRRKSELFFGSQNRNLNDFDSYEVIGKRVDPNGITRFQVLWKSHGDDEYDDDDEDIPEDEMENMEVSGVAEVHPFAALNLFGASDSE